MTKLYVEIVCLLLIAMLLVPTAQAAVYTEYDLFIDMNPEGSFDLVQNNLDGEETTNYDTWDPKPEGVYYGSWSQESRVRYNEVPDTDFSIALATVCRFGSEVVMSGAARTLVRLPIESDETYLIDALLHVYEISEDSDWTFSYDDGPNGYAGSHLDYLKVNFTDGSRELVYFSEFMLPEDTSPTDENAHFTRTNRMYAFVDAPLKADTYYLFIVYAWYSSDAYVDFYIQPESLTGFDGWNRSTVAHYNEIAPDAYTLDVYDINASLGWSFDFRNGFGNSAYGANIYMEAGDYVEFASYVDPDTIDPAHYMTFMFPYVSAISNVSWNVSIYEMRPLSASLLVQWNNYPCRDFILLSMAHAWSSNVSGTFNGWFWIRLQILNDTRIKFPMWDTNIPAGAPTLNATWAWFPRAWDSDIEFSWNMRQWMQHEHNYSTEYWYFWTPQHTIQWNNYRWTRSVGAGSGTETPDPTANMTFIPKVIYTLGALFISAGTIVAYSGIPGGGSVLRHIGVQAQVWALANEGFDPLQPVRTILTILKNQIAAFGEWIWTVGQKIVGAVKWFVETFVYYGSIVLGILILILSMVVFWTPLYFTAKGAMAFRKAILGDIEGAMDEVKGASTTVLGMARKVGGGLRRG